MGGDIIFAIALLGGLLFLLLIGLEIAWSVGVIALIGLIFFVDQPVNQIAYTTWDSLNSFTLTAMPLFILMGAIGKKKLNGLQCSLIAILVFLFQKELYIINFDIKTTEIEI